jgi:hypothetical protein
MSQTNTEQLPSLFTSEGLAFYQRRIDQLTPATAALWGKMNVSQMLAHCQAPLNVAVGRHELPKYNFLLKLVGKMVRNQLIKDETPFKKNQPTDKSFVRADERDFSKEKELLKESLARFSAAGKSKQLPGEHPFFGKLNLEQWDRLQYKHIDHHLRQFGV